MQGAQNSMNEIDKKQVETRMLNLLRARTLIYRRAKNVQAVGLIISLVFPFVGLDLQPATRTKAIENPRNREEARCAKAGTQTNRSLGSSSRSTLV